MKKFMKFTSTVTSNPNLDITVDLNEIEFISKLTEEDTQSMYIGDRYTLLSFTKLYLKGGRTIIVRYDYNLLEQIIFELDFEEYAKR
jgi:hypothetical protein